ncbi:neutral/alkaline non-lysosomal ceramidase N-terminal domain-containing protein [Paenibacillus flagellatus]|uniref:Neutral/alkaline non-lysosomal ceramidase N-terminal domain-containing protein n=1 Tax=Paenibacillus flagellatus TaxID=2211139 RepID=A0A2V5JYZ2_9BACL|nr:neutral/alkaline non-lysosomal ceramidase N-terminal domain-containing protein [Paenibacillus flagellatus]PYI52139.1 hypothetical protein DLM86_21930 [Paenibacillus flagellatus]
MSGDGGGLLLGTAKVDITPERPIPLAGFGHRKGPYAGVNRRLYARINVFEQARDGAKRRLLVAQADIIWWGGERMAGIRETLRERFGIGPSDLILSAQHTHGGPQTSAQFCGILGLPDPSYMDGLEEALYRGVETALSGLEPVTVERGSGECRIGVNRRLAVDGAMTMAPNPDGPYDPEVSVIRFRKDNGGEKAVFVHYACHPTTTGENFVTSEYPGVAAERLEATLGCGAVVSFLQGCTGDIRPALHREGKFYSGGDADVRRLGRALADEVERVLDRPMKRLPVTALSGRRLVVQLPFQAMPTSERIEERIAQGGPFAEWGEAMRSRPELLRPEIPFELTRLDVAEGLSFLAMDGEVVLEYGLYVKAKSGGTTLPMGYSNGMIGYVPTASQIAEGGYEANDSGIYFALPAPFAPEIEPVIKQAIDELIGGGR